MLTEREKIILIAERVMGWRIHPWGRIRLDWITTVGLGYALDACPCTTKGLKMDELKPPTPERDWRRNPVAGDELKWGSIRVLIESADGKSVCFRHMAEDRDRWSNLVTDTPQYFRAWAATAEIVRRGDA